GKYVVLAVTRQLGFVDRRAHAGHGAYRDAAVDDLQWFGQQVIGHVQEVGQFAGTAAGGLEGGTEGDGGQRADLGVDLVAHGDVHAQPGAEAQGLVGFGEARAGGLDADRVGATGEQLARDIAGGRYRFVGDDRDRGALDQAAAAHRFLGIARLFEHGQAQTLGLAQYFHGLVGGPAAVGVQVDLHVLAQPFAQHAAGFDIQRPRAAADLELEGGDAVLLAEAQGLIEQFLGRAEAEHVAHAHRVGEPAEQLVHRGAQRLADGIPDGDVQRALGHLVVDGPIQHLADLRAV